MKPLHWDEYGVIAEALAAAYPDADRINMSREDLLRLIVALPNFEDTPEPGDPDLLDAVLYAWIALDGDGDEETPPD